MAANTRARAGGYSNGDVPGAAEFNTFDLNGAQSINRNSTKSGVRAIPFQLVGVSSGGPSWIIAAGVTLIGNSAGSVTLALDNLPVGHLLTGVTIRLLPAGSHGGKPDVLPILDVYARPRPNVPYSGAQPALTPILTGTHTWSNVSTYELGIDVTATGTPHTILADSQYFAELTVESGTNSKTGTSVLHMDAAVTIDAAEGGADFTHWAK